MKTGQTDPVCESRGRSVEGVQAMHSCRGGDLRAAADRAVKEINGGRHDNDCGAARGTLGPAGNGEWRRQRSHRAAIIITAIGKRS